MEIMLPPNMWFQDLVCKAVRDLGGSADTDAIYEKAVEIGRFSDEQLALPAPGDRAQPQSRVHSEISSALSRAKADGRLDNPSDGVWVSVG